MRHFIYSLGIHALIISFILTLPGYSGNPDTFAFQSMSVFLGVAEVREAIFAGMGAESNSVEEHIRVPSPEETESESPRVPEVQVDEAADLQEIIAPVEKVDTEGNFRLSGDEEGPAAERSGAQSGDQAQLVAEEVKETTGKKNPEPVKSNPKPEKSKPKRAERSVNVKQEIKESLSTAALDVKKMKELAGRDVVADNGKPEKEAAARHESALVEKAKIPSPVPLAEEEKGVVPAGPEPNSAPAVESGHSIRDEDGKKMVSEDKTQAPVVAAVETRAGKETKNEPAPKSESKEGQGPVKILKSEAAKAAGKTSHDSINQSQIGNRKNEGKASAEPEKKNGKNVLQAREGGQTGPRNSVPDHNAPNGVNRGGAKDRPEAIAGAGHNGGHEPSGQQQTGGSRRPELRGVKTGENDKLGLGLPKPPSPQLSDIRIEVNFNGGDEKKISMDLLKKAYPVPEKKPQKKKREEVGYPFERKTERDVSGVKNVLTVLKAEKGAFTFTIDNGGDGCTARILFRIYEGTPRERVKEYKLVQIQPGIISRFKFILPDALFWDDEDRFSGEIENSISKTKFYYDTGLVWTEDKED